MNLSIQQDPTELRNSIDLQRRAEIASIRMISASIKSNPKLDGLTEPIKVKVGYRPVSSEFRDQLFIVNLDFALTAVDGADPQNRVFSIRCVFQLTYELEKEYQPTQEQMDAFAAGNAIFNAWPFFREFAQSMSARAGVPAYPTVPFLRIGPKPKENAKVAEQEAPAKIKSPEA